MGIEGNQESENIFKVVTPENIQKFFELARDSIEDSYKMKLSQIELVGLRRIAAQVMVDAAAQENRGTHAQSDFSPWEEIPARFMLEFYEMTPGDTYEWETSGYDFPEFVRRKQAEKHMP